MVAPAKSNAAYRKILKRRYSFAGGQLFEIGNRITETRADYLPKMPKTPKLPIAIRARNMDGLPDKCVGSANKTVATAVSSNPTNDNLVSGVGSHNGILESNGMDRLSIQLMKPCLLHRLHC